MSIFDRLWLMTKLSRNARWARISRANLREVLGGKCSICMSESDLEFDCIKPMGDKHHKMASHARVTFYRRQHLANNLQLLCKWCHARKTAADNFIECWPEIPLPSSVTNPL
jgi:hypothetical protein